MTVLLGTVELIHVSLRTTSLLIFLGSRSGAESVVWDNLTMTLNKMLKFSTFEIKASLIENESYENQESLKMNYRDLLAIMKYSTVTGHHESGDRKFENLFKELHKPTYNLVSK